ncbi:MAG TPA: hypothetical protein VL593_09840 [Ramlibacter sp.]|jgi:hypothetical protein|nr:hypothetical protein [Ramlibacter sp.]
MRAHPIRIALAAGALVGLAGCVAYPVGPYGYNGYGDPYGQGIVAPMAPPPVVAENYGLAPWPGALWIGGYWSWSGGRHSWTPGRWERPRAGYHWAPRTWEQHGHEWHQRGGRWERG